jgi:hypothetical protein
LQYILPAFDLRPVCNTPFQFDTRTKLIAVWGPGFRRSRNGEAVLLALEKLFCQLEFAAPPLVSVIELLKSSHAPRRWVCTGRYFAVIAVPGGGDLILEFRSRLLVEHINALIAANWRALSPSGIQLRA